MSKKEDVEKQKKINALKQKRQKALNKQTWTTDKAGTSRTSNDGYIAPTAKGQKIVDKARSMGIEHNYIDPTNEPKAGFNRTTKEYENKLKKR